MKIQCPSCDQEEFKVYPFSGKEGEYFIRIICHNCDEHLFFQTPYSLSSKIESDKDNDTNKSGNEYTDQVEGILRNGCGFNWI